MVLHNFNREPQQASVQLPGEGADLLVNLLENDDSRAAKDGTHRISLHAYGYKWYRIGGLNYAQSREPAAPDIRH